MSKNYKKSAGGRCSIEDVAARAKVSKSTVSNVFTAKRYTSEGIKKRVLKAAEELGYRPHYAARLLARRCSKTIGVIVQRIDDFCNPVYLAAIDAACKLRGYIAYPVIVGDDIAKVQKCISYFVNGQADGVLILTNTVTDEMISELVQGGYPVGAILRNVPGQEGLSVVDVDAGVAFRRLLDYLYSIGHCEFGFVLGAPSDIKVRYNCIQEFMAEKKLKYTPERELLGLNLPEEAEVQTKEMLERLPEITALVCSNDILAWGAMAAAHSLGLSLPEDLTITGFDDLPISRYCNPQLTTVRMPLAEIAKTELNSLIDRIENKHSETVIKMTPELIIRDSSVPPRR